MRKPKKAAKIKASKKRGVPRKQEESGSPRHRRDFDQLLDDAIFGVKKKNPRG